MHGDYVKKDKNNFNLFERHCHKCGAISCVHKQSLNRQCRSCANIERATTHGLSKHPLYSVWESMVSRCERVNSINYKYYGAKGIKVCRKWRDNPSSFVSWALDEGYKKGLQIDRINSNGDYEPKNCRFISKTENCRRAGKKSKLTKSQVFQIKKRIKKGEKGKNIANEFKVSPSSISAIKRMMV